MVANECKFIATRALRCPQILEYLSAVSFDMNEFSGPLFPYGVLVHIATDHFKAYKVPPPSVITEAALGKVFEQF